MRLDLTQRALADAVGCAAITIRKIEADQLRPSRQIASRLFDALELPPAERAVFAARARGEPFAPPLPVLLAPLIGREAAASAVCELVQRADVRLVTLYGPPGIGKTSLAMEVANRLHGHYADGALWVALADLDDPGHVLATIAAALGLHETGDRPLRGQLQVALRDRELLLAIDNFEHVLDAAPELAVLLAGAPGITVLVTSRALLRVAGERSVLLAPLALPMHDGRPSLLDTAGSAAVQLFVQRAQAVAPGFALTDANAAAIGAICARMDGVPLAIELAAARMRLWSADALLARLEHPLPLLTGGRRDQPPRQRSLRDAIAWSYRLLDRQEQRVFRWLGVFAGGFTVEAAVQLLADSTPVLGDTLQTFLDTSLVQYRPAGARPAEQRLDMLQTVRAFAREQLTASGEASDACARHARYVLGLAQAAERACWDSDWLERMDAEHANARAALDWLGNANPETGLRLACALDRFWFARGYVSEGRSYLRTLLAVAGEAADALRAQALSNAGFLAWFQSDRRHAAGYFREANALFAVHDNHYGQAWTLLGLARVARFDGDYAAAEAYCRSSVAHFRAVNDTCGRGWVANEQGQIALMQSQNERAAQHFTGSRAVFEDIKQVDGIADALWGTGSAALALGDYGTAEAAYAESLVLWRAAGEKLGAAGALAGLGSVALARQHVPRARGQLHASLALHWELGNTWGLVQDLVALAALETLQRAPNEHPRRRYERVLRILGATGVLRHTGVPLWPVYEAWCSRAEADARGQLGSAAAAAAFAEGRLMALAELVDRLIHPTQSP